MSYVTLTEAKEQVGLSVSNPAHDARLLRLIAAAEAWAEGFLNAPLSDYEDSPVQSPPEIPEDIKSAVLLHVELEFDRDEKVMTLLFRRAEQLLWKYRTQLGV